MKHLQRILNEARRVYRNVPTSGTAPLLGLLGAVALVCLLLWQMTPASEFGLNAFTETLGIMLTVLVVDRLFRLQEARRNVPLKAAAHRDVSLLVTRTTALFQSMHLHAVPEPSPTAVDVLFSPSTYQKVASLLNVDGDAPVVPARPWHRFMNDFATEQQALANRILERYPAVLDPHAYSQVHELQDGVLTFLTLPLRFRDLDRQMGYPRPKFLAANMPEPSFASLLALVEWCRLTEIHLRGQGVADLTSVHIELRQETPRNPPASMISSSQAAQQAAEWSDFQASVEVSTNFFH